MTSVAMMDTYTRAGWTGTLDIACGGPRDGHTWQSAASGSMDKVWRATCQAVRVKWGRLTQVHLSLAHEMNGTWYPWSVDPSNVAAFKKGWARWHGIVQEELVNRGKDVQVCLSLNSDNLAGVSVQKLRPSTKYFDVLGCDFYSMYPELTNESEWTAHRYDLAEDGSPRGIQAWLDYARSLSKPISFPEWALNPEHRRENPYFIQKMRDTFKANGCAVPTQPKAGEVAGEAYFNASDNCRIWPSTQLPLSASRYRTLTWGH